jgi:serine/threonine protein kinase
MQGILANNIKVAVKQLFIKTQHGSEDFLNEILLISNLQHHKLVALKGYCLHGKEMFLVYEFVDFCDLENFLFGKHFHNWCLFIMIYLDFFGYMDL